jgi:hypothetical protein
MGDLLSAASLLLTIITVLYALWNPAIKATLDAQVPTFKAQAIKPLQEITSVIWKQAVPLALAAYTIALVFAKDAVSLCSKSWRSYTTIGVGETLAQYDAVGTAFVLVVFLSLALAVQLSLDCKKLFSQRRKLRAVSK